MSKYNYENQRNDYLSPFELVEEALNFYNIAEFDIDVCCSQSNIPAKKHFFFNQKDGLKENWGKFNWCNPPFNECKRWIEKAVKEQKKGNNTAMLIPVRTENVYWHENILNNNDVFIHWLKKGYRFINPETKEPMGVFKNALALVYFNGEYKNEYKKEYKKELNYGQEYKVYVTKNGVEVE